MDSINTTFTLLINHLIKTYKISLLYIDPKGKLMELIIQLQNHRNYYGYNDSNIKYYW